MYVGYKYKKQKMQEKQKILLKQYKKQSSKINQILFTKTTKQRMLIQILVLDLTLVGRNKYQVGQEQIDAITQVYQLCINNDKQNMKLLRMVNGYTGIEKYLSVSGNWLFDPQTKIFKLSNQKIFIYEHQATKNRIFDVFDLQDIIYVLQDNQYLSSMQTKYIINKALKILSNQKQHKTQINRQQVLIKKEKRMQQYKKQKNKKAILYFNSENANKFKQFQILNHIRNDSYCFDSFCVDDMTIVKQYEKDMFRCLFGFFNISKKNIFTIKIDKLSKQNRDPVIWIGIADISCLKQQNIQDIINIIAMSDQKKITYLSQPHKTRKLTPKNKNNQFNKLQQIKQTDTITVHINQQEGFITWTNTNNKQELGSHYSEFIKCADIQWVPFVSMCKIGDGITWCE